MTNQYIAETILSQLGGGRFIAMTGAKEFVAIDNGLRFRIGRNASKANRVTITLNGKDLYDVKFTKFSPSRLKVDHKKGTAEWVDQKNDTVKAFEDLFCDQLQEIFTDVTGLYTHF